MRLYRHGTGAAVALLVFFTAALDVWAEVHYDGGFRVTPKTRDVPPGANWRRDSHPSMHFGLPRLPASGNYRAYYTPPAATPERAAPPTNPYGIPASVLPWLKPGFEGYEEPPYRPGHKPLGHAEKYTLESHILPEPAPDQRPNIAVLVVHLPRQSPLWIEGSLTASKGRTRYFESPPLTPGKRYHYTVRSVWFEDGKWVSQSQQIPLVAGRAHCVYLTLTPAGLAKLKLEKQVANNLAQLAPEDRKAAQLQKFCAVQQDCRLGSKGVPVKVVVKSRRVFVATPEGVRIVKKQPDEMLARALELRKKNAALADGK